MTELIKDKEAALAILDRISNEPLKKDSHFYSEFGAKRINDVVNLWTEDHNSKEFQPSIFFLRDILAANRKYNTHVKPNIDRIIKENKDFSFLDSLNKINTTKTQDEFYKFWGHSNPKKYSTLIDLLKAVKQLRIKYKISDDYLIDNKIN